MSLLDKKKLLAKEELEKVKVHLNKTDFIFVRQMTGREKNRWEQSLRVKTTDKKGAITGYRMNLDDYNAKLAVQTICDEKGELLLESTDYATLSQNMSAHSLETIIKIARKINKLGEDEKETLVKNSEAAQSGASISDSVPS